jgi:hypothetical protein
MEFLLSPYLMEGIFSLEEMRLISGKLGAGVPLIKSHSWFSILAHGLVMH